MEKLKYECPIIETIELQMDGVIAGSGVPGEEDMKNPYKGKSRSSFWGEE